MILQQLDKHFDIINSRTPDVLPPYGYSFYKCQCCIILSGDGKWDYNDIRIETRSKNGKRSYRPIDILIPIIGTRGSEIAPILCADNTKYIFGIAVDSKGKINEIPSQDELAKHAASIELHNTFAEKHNDIPAFALVANFIANATINDLMNIREELRVGSFVFRMAGESEYIHHHRVVKEYVRPQNTVEGVCMVSGEVRSIARCHPVINVSGKHKPKLISFNNESTRSYGYVQGYNAPVSELSAFRYTSVLNHLLTNKITLGGLDIVYWSNSDTDINIFSNICTGVDLEQEAKNLLEAPHTGDNTISSVQCYILGLEPKEGRVVVRIWYDNDTNDLHTKIKQHLKDTQCIDGIYLSIARILKAIGFKSKDNSIPAKLSEITVSSILNNTIYPMQFADYILPKIKAQGKVYKEQAAILRGWYNRRVRFGLINDKEISIMLDESNDDIAYNCGRLFAVYSKIYRDANPKSNSSIECRHYRSTMENPAKNVTLLEPLITQHLGKLTEGSTVFYKKKIAAIFDLIREIPKRLDRIEQVRFVIGYHHQISNLFRKENDKVK